MPQFIQELPRLWLDIESYHTMKLDKDRSHQLLTQINTLIYVLEGKGQVHDVLGNHRVQAGDFLFYPAEERLKFQNSSSACFVLKKIEFASMRVERKKHDWKLKSYSMPFWGIMYPTSLTATQYLIEKLCMKLDRRFSYRHIRDRSMFYELWERLSDATKEAKIDQELEMEHVADMLKEHVQDKIVIEELAQRVGLNVSEFFKRFKHQYGASPGQYLIEQRIRKSLELLTGTHLKVSEVAHAVGYDDEYYFSRVFKKKLGVSPVIFLEKTRKKIVALTPEIKNIVRTIGIKPCFLTSDTPQESNWDELLTEINEKQPAYIFIPSRYEYAEKELLNIAPVYALADDNVEVGLTQILYILKLEELTYDWLLAYHMNEQQ